MYDTVVFVKSHWCHWQNQQESRQGVLHKNTRDRNVKTCRSCCWNLTTCQWSTEGLVLFCCVIHIWADICLFWQLSYINEYVFISFLLYILKNLCLIQSRGLFTKYHSGWQHKTTVPTIHFLTLCTGIWNVFLRDCKRADMSFWGSVMITVTSTALRQCSIAYLILHSVQADRTGSY